MSEPASKQTEECTVVLTAAELIRAREALDSMAKVELPFITAYRLVRLIEHLRPQFAATEKTRIRIFEKFGNRNGNGDRIEIPAERLAEFNAEFIPFAESRMELKVGRLPASLFNSAPSITLEMLSGLMPFIEEDE